MHSTKLGAHDISLLGQLNWIHITRLSLRNCFVNELLDRAALTDAMQAFTAGNWPCLEVLDVSNNSMYDTVIHQLTQCLSPSTSLKEIRLGGNGVAYWSDVVTMSSWECASMGNWQNLRSMDLQDTILSPQDVELLLWSSSQSLDTLHVSCQVSQTTTARPSKECWPCNTTMNMIVAVGTNLCEVLCICQQDVGLSPH